MRRQFFVFVCSFFLFVFRERKIQPDDADDDDNAFRASDGKGERKRKPKQKDQPFLTQPIKDSRLSLSQAMSSLSTQGERAQWLQWRVEHGWGRHRPPLAMN